MTDRPVKIPGPDHPIAITPQPALVVVTAGGKVLKDDFDFCMALLEENLEIGRAHV